MKDDLGIDIDHPLLSGSDRIKAGYSSLIKNCGKLIAGLTATIVVLATFTEIGFYDIGVRELTANVLLILVASYVIYFSLEDAGEVLARESDEYRSVYEKLTTLSDKITAEMIPRLRIFIDEYVSEELRHRREALLSIGGKTFVDYEVYLSGERVSGRDKRLYRRVSRLSEIKLGVGTLLSTRRELVAEIKNPRGSKLIGLCVRLIPTTICTIFTASVMLGVKDGLCATEIIEGLVRLCPLPIVALRGYSQGYDFVKGKEVDWMKGKSRLIEAFLRTECK